MPTETSGAAISLVETARRLAEMPLEAWCGLGSDGYCIACDTPVRYDGSGHEAGCPVLALPRIVEALELAERFGIVFEQQDDAVRIISNPRKRWRLNDRALRVMDAADRLPGDEPCEEYGTERLFVFCRGDALVGRHHPDCRYQALVKALRGEAEVKAGVQTRFHAGSFPVTVDLGCSDTRER